MRHSDLLLSQLIISFLWSKFLPRNGSIVMRMIMNLGIIKIRIRIIYYKVNRCLARYSPRATTTNQPTNRAPNEPARPIFAQESILWGKNGRFWAKHLNYFGIEQMFLYPHIRKPIRHLIPIVSWSGIARQ